jgi:hypothetical protein
VPQDGRHIYEHEPTHSQSIPYGRLCHEAAAALAARDERVLELERSIFNTTERLHTTQQRVRKLESALHGMLAIVNDSRGVAGYHRNGDVAEWDEFEEVGLAEVVLAPPAKEPT